MIAVGSWHTSACAPFSFLFFKYPIRGSCTCIATTERSQIFLIGTGRNVLEIFDDARQKKSVAMHRRTSTKHTPYQKPNHTQKPATECRKQKQIGKEKPESWQSPIIIFFFAAKSCVCVYIFFWSAFERTCHLLGAVALIRFCPMRNQRSPCVSLSMCGPCVHEFECKHTLSLLICRQSQSIRLHILHANLSVWCMHAHRSYRRYVLNKRVRGAPHTKSYFGPRITSANITLDFIW